MFRPVTSDVSVLSDFVAKGHQTMHSVSSSLPKIPYVGFSPVRLQTGHPPPPSRPATQRPLIGGCSPRGTTDPDAPLNVGAGAARHGRSGPEALGSPSGCVVPSGHRLLRPHPPLWVSLGDFGSCTYTPSLCRQAKAQSFPNLLCVSLLPCRLPYPDGPSGPDGWAHPLALAFALFERARHPRCSTQAGSCMVFLSGLQSSLYATARQLARPTPARTFTSELSSHESPHWNVGYNYAGKPSIPAAGLSPAGHAALWAALEYPTPEAIGQSRSDGKEGR